MKTTILVLITIIAIAFTSCQDKVSEQPIMNNDEMVLKSAEISTSDIHLENIFEEVSHEAEMFAEYEHILRRLAHVNNGMIFGKGNNKRYMAKEAITVTVDTSENRYPISITLDYGDSTLLKNGRVISGVIVVEISAEKGTDGATRKLSYQNLYVDSIGIEGEAVHTFNGDNETSRMVTTTSEITFTLPDGTVVEREGSHLRNWLEGLATPQEREDDLIEISGSLTMTSSTGDVWSRVIVEPLLRQGDCKHPVSGLVNIIYNEEVISEIDFGNGECDDLAVMTTGGEQIEIELQGDRPEAKVNGNDPGKNNKSQNNMRDDNNRGRKGGK